MIEANGASAVQVPDPRSAQLIQLGAAGRDHSPVDGMLAEFATSLSQFASVSMGSV